MSVTPFPLHPEIREALRAAANIIERLAWEARMDDDPQVEAVIVFFHDAADGYVGKAQNLLPFDPRTRKQLK